MTAKMLNREKVLARLAKLPRAMQTAAAAQLDKEVDGLVSMQKRLAPNDPETGGNRIAAAIRAYPNPDRPLSYRVISDARDEKGKPIAANVEHGHRNVDGTHTPGKPSFFPAYRSLKTKMRRRVLNASRKALKQLYPG